MRPTASHDARIGAFALHLDGALVDDDDEQDRGGIGQGRKTPQDLHVLEALAGVQRRLDAGNRPVIDGFTDPRARETDDFVVAVENVALHADVGEAARRLLRRRGLAAEERSEKNRREHRHAQGASGGTSRALPSACR